MHSIEIRFIIQPQKYTFSRRVCARFSREILQAGGMKVLISGLLFCCLQAGTKFESITGAVTASAIIFNPNLCTRFASKVQ